VWLRTVPALAVPGPAHRYASIVELCAVPRSVAEVAASLSVPLCVIRVLLADLVRMGVVTVSQQPCPGAGLDAALLERVRGGLRRL
jgi:hypothetical protein